MTYQVGPDGNITHHVKLSDGSKEIAFVLCNNNGEMDATAIQEYPLERTALRSAAGSPTYSDFNLPWMPIAQDEWAGGQGLEDFDKDTSRYLENHNTNVLSDGVVLGGQANYTSGSRGLVQSTSGSIRFVPLTGTELWLSTPITPSATFTAVTVEFEIKQVGTPNAALNAKVYSDSAGDPNAQQASLYGTYAVGTASSMSTLVSVTFAASSALTNATAYHVVFYGNGSDDANNHWEIGCLTVAGKKSSDGSAWSSYTYSPYVRVLDGAGLSSAKFFEYKRSLYMVTRPDSGNSYLWINGDRGAADSNVADKSLLNDATKTWTADEWIGAQVLIIKGPGSEEKQPWRTIIDNGTATLTVSPDWLTTHTTSTEYVIVDTNKWTSVLDLGGVVTDVAVAGEYVYFARDTSLAILRYQAYNNGGAWTSRNTADTEKARYLLAIRHPDDGLVVYGYLPNHGFFNNVVWRGRVPPAWGDLYYTLGSLVDTDEPWDKHDATNVTHTSDGYSTIITIAAGFTTGIAAVEEFDAVDITRGQKLGFLIYSTVSTNLGDLELHYSDTAAVDADPPTMGGTPVVIDIPALTANTYTWVELDIAPVHHTAPDETAVISVGLNVAVDNAAQTVYIHGGIQVLSTNLEFIDFLDDVQITNMIDYSGNESDPRINPWIITEDAIYEIQTQNSNVVVPLPLGELTSLKASNNGKAACVNDVYLWFNLGRKLQRYYARNLEDVGPDREAGMAESLQGTPSFVLSHPGRVFLGIDGEASNYSSVLVYRSSGWSEVYRAPRTGLRINDGYYQSIQGSGTGRLWLNQYRDILWIPVSMNPYRDEDYTFTHQGYLTGSYIYGGLQDVIKIWNSLKLFVENVSAGNRYLQADYRLDDDSAWTEIDGSFDTEPVEKIDLSTATPPNVTGRRFQYRIRFYTNDNSESPRLKTSVVEAVAVIPVKYGYAFSAKFFEYNEDIDLEGLEDETYLDTAAKRAQMNEWLAAGRALTFSSAYKVWNDKTVYLDPASMRPLELHEGNAPGDAHERHIIQVAVNEL